MTRDLTPARLLLSNSITLTCGQRTAGFSGVCCMWHVSYNGKTGKISTGSYGLLCAACHVRLCLVLAMEEWHPGFWGLGITKFAAWQRGGTDSHAHGPKHPALIARD